MSFSQITKEDLVDRGVLGLPDTPNLGTTEMQRRFDELSREVIIPKVNNLITELESKEASASIGVTVPEGIEADQNIQSIVNAISVILVEVAKQAYTAYEKAYNAEKRVEDAVKTVNDISYMYDPATGKYLPINEVITNMYDLLRPAALTADAYAALQLTADEYASFNITAYDYSYYAANILVK